VEEGENEPRAHYQLFPVEVDIQRGMSPMGSAAIVRAAVTS
jgi:hypothetical protein